MKPTTYPVIDADGHWQDGVGIDWDKHLPSQYRALGPHMIPFDTGGGKLVMEGRIWLTPYRGRQTNGKDLGDIHREREGMWVSSVRLKHLDAEGIDTAVIFGSLVCLGVCGVHDLDLGAAIARAYNDGTAEYCSADPRRMKAVAAVPLQNIEAAVSEAHRAVKQLGCVGIVVPPNVHGRNLDTESFFPVYQAAQELNVPICVHGSSGLYGVPFAGVERFNDFFYAHAVAHPFEQMIAAASLVCNGVLDKFPKLRVAFLEGQCGWVPFWMERLDEHFEVLGRQVPIKVKPSVYMKGPQCYYSIEVDETTVDWVMGEVGNERLLYASDYWHWDAKFPDSVRSVTARKTLSDQQKKMLLRDNAIRLYNLKTNGK